jgi:uncharacterized membrane protein YphA (DoxX/SURF4 family)
MTIRYRMLPRAAFGALWLALAAQVAWMAGDLLLWHSPDAKPVYDALLVVLFGALAVTRGRSRRVAAVVRAAIGLAFALSVADRLGLLGPPGSAGVSWGGWPAFVAYTRSVNAFLPAAAAPVLAVLATVAEAGLGLALLLGVRLRPAAAGAGALTLLYAVAMTISLPPYAQFQYAVLAFSAAAWALATVDASPLSLDALAARLRARPAAAPRAPAAPPPGPPAPR